MSNVTQFPRKGVPGRIPNGSQLPPGGGDSTYDPMEARVTKLETDLNEMKVRLAGMDAKMSTKDDISGLRADISEVKGLLKAMPSTLHLLGFVITIFVAAGLLRVFLPS